MYRVIARNDSYELNVISGWNSEEKIEFYSQMQYLQSRYEIQSTGGRIQPTEPHMLLPSPESNQYVIP